MFNTLRLTDCLKVTALASIIFLTACSTTITAKDIDPSHHYDGTWLVQIHKTFPNQSVAGWSMSCSDNSGNFGLLVEDSIVYLNFLGNTHQSYVAANGSFKIAVESDYVAEESASSDVRLSAGSITYFFKGSFNENKRKGFFTVGIQALGNNGCRSKMTFVQKEDQKT